MLHGPKKRTRVSDEESDNSMEGRKIFDEILINVKNRSEERAGNIMQKDLKRMRLDLDRDTSRVVPSEFTNSSSESSPRTPSSHSTHTDTTEYNKTSSYQYHQIHQHKQQSLDDDNSLLSPNVHKLHRNPIRISTRSDASSSSSSTELLNPYMNINSVLYLANLARTSHIVKELQDDLGCMEIDERADIHNNERGQLIGNGTSSSMEDVEDNDSMNLGLGHSSHHYQFQNGEYVNSSSEESEYQSINAILREAFLERRPNLSC